MSFEDWRDAYESTRKVVRYWSILCAAGTLYAFLGLEIFAGETYQGNWGVVALGGVVWFGGSFLIVAFSNPER